MDRIGTVIPPQLLGLWIFLTGCFYGALGWAQEIIPPDLIGTGLGNFSGVLEPGDRFGAGVANLGDVDGDGIIDELIAAVVV